jgi:hypothetical protein
MVILITLTTAGADTGPFNLFSNVDGFSSPFETGVSKAALLAGYTTLLAPPGTTVVRVKSAGTCTNQINVNVVPCSITTTTTSSSTSSTTTTTTTAFVVNLSICYTQVAGGQATGTVSTDSPTNTILTVGIRIYDDLSNSFTDTVTVLNGATSGVSSIVNLTNGGASATSIEITSITPSSFGGYDYQGVGATGGDCGA